MDNNQKSAVFDDSKHSHQNGFGCHQELNGEFTSYKSVELANGNLIEVQESDVTNEKDREQVNGNFINGDGNVNGNFINAEHVNCRFINGEHVSGNFINGGNVPGNFINGEISDVRNIPTYQAMKDEALLGRQLSSNSKLVIETTELTSDVLKDLFDDKICVLCVRNYVPKVVCDKLDAFLQEKGSEPYTHEIRNEGKVDLQYFGVNRYGFPLNSIYTDDSGKNLEKYLLLALPTMRSIRKAAAPYLTPIDKFRVELDEAWPQKANVATLNGHKTFCGIGRIMPTSLSELSEVHPHFDAVPTSCFPNIHKQFTANFYLNVPEKGGELEIWNVPPLDISEVESFKIPDNWRSRLPASMKVKPEQGDLLLFNTRRPHAITKFTGHSPRVSIQTFIGYTKEEEVFLWV